MRKKYEEVGKIYKTDNYDEFIFIKGNRDIKKSNVNKLKKKIQKNGYDVGIPITVLEINEKLVIIDGQHRYIACKELGLPIYFTYSTIEDMSVKEIVKKISDLNTNGCNWSTDDFIKKEIELGNENYKLLQQLCNKLDTVDDIKMCADYMYATRIKGGKQLAALRDGTFIYTVEGEATACAIDNEFKQLLNCIAPAFKDIFNTKRYKHAYLQIRNEPNFHFNRLLNTLSRDTGVNLSRRGDSTSAYTSLVGIYNHSLKDKSKKIPL